MVSPRYPCIYYVINVSKVGNIYEKTKLATKD
jgi:hypothetical protein